MKYRLFAFLMFSILYADANAQARQRKLPTVINHPSLNVQAPFISTDANAMVFLTDYSEDKSFVPFYSFKDNADWKEPVALPKSVHTKLNFLKGYGLSADGKNLYISTMKSPGVGGYDIWISEWKSGWNEPVNPGIPINSKSHEACPSLTPDGNTIYFMRCESMDANKAGNCKLFSTTKKPNGQWSEAVELPAHINTGNSQTPRIMADAQTLIFSSDKLQPSKGGMDLYVTKFSDGAWSAPQALDFVNTPQDDQFVSVSANGRYLLRDTQGPRKFELIEYLLPDAQRPAGMMKIEGRITDESGAAVPTFISVTGLSSKKRVYNGRPAGDGSYRLYLREGEPYEFAVDPEQNNAGYFLKMFDLSPGRIIQNEKLNVVIRPFAAGNEVNLDFVKFLPNTAVVDVTASASELKRFSRAFAANPSLKAELQVMLTGYVEDSLQHDDLTEVYSDTVVYTMELTDSLGNPYAIDSTAIEYTYHNNRTEKQALALIDYLVSQGLPRERFTYMVNAIQSPTPEERRLSIKAVLKN